MVLSLPSAVSGLLDKVKGTPFALPQRKITTTTSHARIVYWHYDQQNFLYASNTRVGPPGNVTGVTRGVIQTEIESVDTQKSIRNAAGTFDISLLPTKNWRQVLAPGDWVVIYLFNDAADSSEGITNKNIVMIGNIDRIARVKQKDEQTDKTTVRYSVSGRDFGKVFEETDIFFNPYGTPTGGLTTFLQQRGLILSGTSSKLVDNFVDVFLSPTGATLDDPALGSASTESLNQWKIPDELSMLLGGGGTSFHDILQKRIAEDLPGYKALASLTPGSNGALWGHLKRSSNDPVNHLYLDLARDQGGKVRPAITLRPIPTSPFFFDVPGQLGGTHFNLQELASDDVLEISTDEIKFENLGRDGNYRFNMIYMVPKFSGTTEAVSQFASIGVYGVGIGLPMQNAESIQRYGLRKLSGTLEFVYNDQLKDTTLDVMLVKSVLNLIYDLHAYHHLYETGTIECSGVLEAELGKVLRIGGASTAGFGEVQPPAKLYLVEGYKHSWRFPNQWTTEFNVTMGQWDDPSLPFIDLDAIDFGQPDLDFNASSLVKTNVTRPGMADPDLTSLGNAAAAAFDAMKGLG